MKSPFSEADYKAGASEWRAFLSSSIWFDLQLFMTDVIEANRDRLEMTDEERLLVANEGRGHFESADIIRGRNRAILDLLKAPEAILQELQESGEVEEETDD